MPDQLWAQEWRDEGVGNLYPFADGATLVDQSGTIALDRDMFLDASLYPLGGDNSLYLSQADVVTGGVNLWFGTPAHPQLCVAGFNPLALPASIDVLDVYDRPAGILICGAPTALAVAQTWPVGTYRFDPAATSLVASCVLPMPDPGVQGFLVNGELVTGDVWLVGRDGVVIRQDTGGAIRFDVVGDPLFVRRLCEPVGLFKTPNFLKTLNGIGPDQYGNFQFDIADIPATDTILRVSPVAEDTLLIQAVGGRIGG